MITIWRRGSNPRRSFPFDIFARREYNLLYKSYVGGNIKKAPEGKNAWTATLGEKGQIVIPKQARDIFEIKPGDTLLLLGDDKRGIAIPPKGAFAELFGIAFQERDGDKE